MIRSSNVVVINDTNLDEMGNIIVTWEFDDLN